jgi:integrase/recombinase XerD
LESIHQTTFSTNRKINFLKEHVLRQHAGWSIGSQMPQIYLHYFWNESSQSLLEAYGIMPKNQHIDRIKTEAMSKLLRAQQPGETSKFCAMCRMVLSCDAYEETIEPGI